MIWINALNSNNTKIGKNQRYVVITSKSALSNYGGAFIITNDFFALIKMNGNSSSDIMWKSKSDANISLNFDASKFQTTIDFLNGAHISVIPIGSIVDAKIDFMFQ